MEYVPQHCKQRTAMEYRRVIEQHINPLLGDQRTAELARADVARMHHQLRDRPYQANFTLAVLCKMMNLAEAWVLRSDANNPVRHVKKYREANGRNRPTPRAGLPSVLSTPCPRAPTKERILLRPRS